MNANVSHPVYLVYYYFQEAHDLEEPLQGQAF